MSTKIISECNAYSIIPIDRGMCSDALSYDIKQQEVSVEKEQHGNEGLPSPEQSYLRFQGEEIVVYVRG